MLLSTKLQQKSKISAKTFGRCDTPNQNWDEMAYETSAFLDIHKLLMPVENALALHVKVRIADFFPSIFSQTSNTN